MLEAVEWGDHDCPDCDKSFATSQEARWYQRYHCDGEASEGEQVMISDNTSLKAYHTDGSCPSQQQMQNRRIVDLAALSGEWRECKICRRRTGSEAKLSGNGQVWIGARNPSHTDKQHVYHTDEECHNLRRMKNPRKTDLTALNGQWRGCQYCQSEDGDVTSHPNPEDDHTLNRAVRNADPEEVFE